MGKMGRNAGGRGVVGRPDRSPSREQQIKCLLDRQRTVLGLDSGLEVHAGNCALVRQSYLLRYRAAAAGAPSAGMEGEAADSSTANKHSSHGGNAVVSITAMGLDIDTDDHGLSTADGVEVGGAAEVEARAGAGPVSAKSLSLVTKEPQQVERKRKSEEEREKWERDRKRESDREGERKGEREQERER